MKDHVCKNIIQEGDKCHLKKKGNTKEEVTVYTIYIRYMII